MTNEKINRIRELEEKLSYLIEENIESHERRVFMAIADGEKSTRYIGEQKKKLHL